GAGPRPPARPRPRAPAARPRPRGLRSGGVDGNGDDGRGPRPRARGDAPIRLPDVPHDSGRDRRRRHDRPAAGPPRGARLHRGPVELAGASHRVDPPSAARAAGESDARDGRQRGGRSRHRRLSLYLEIDGGLEPAPQPPRSEWDVSILSAGPDAAGDAGVLDDETVAVQRELGGEAGADALEAIAA